MLKPPLLSHLQLPYFPFTHFRWTVSPGLDDPQPKDNAQYSLKQKRMCIEPQSIELECVATVVWAMQSTSLVDHTVGRPCLNRTPDWDKPPSIFWS